MLRDRRYRGAALASVVAVVGAFACGAEEKVPTASLRFLATPLPPVAGEPVACSLEGRGIGLVEIYQGSELVHVAVNPFGDAPGGFYGFVARSTERPRAVGYAQDGVRIEREAESGFVRKPAPADAGADASPPPSTEPEVDACPASEEIDPDAGATCGGPGGLAVQVRVRNLRSGDVLVRRTRQPPNACERETVARIVSGTTYPFVAFDQTVLAFEDPTNGTTFRQVKLTFGGSCDLVLR